MNILYITPTYHPHIGGVEYVVKSIAERLARQGHSITVLTGEPETNKPVQEQINKVNIIRWPTWTHNNAYHIPKQRENLKEQLRKLAANTDVIHIHNIHAIISIWTAKQILKSKNNHGKLVITPHYHGTGHTATRKLLWIPWKKYVKPILQQATIHAVSQYEAQVLQENFKVKPIIIEHGVDEKVLEYEWNPQNYIMYSGRIEKYKNIEKIARITKILNQKYGYNLELRIYGEGSYKQKLRKKLDKLGINYTIQKFQPYEKYLETLSKAKLFAQLSQKEAYGQTINEANAIGVPVIVSKPWGMNFLGREGVLIVDFREKDESIALKVHLFLSKYGTYHQVHVFPWINVVNRYANFLYRLSN